MDIIIKYYAFLCCCYYNYHFRVLPVFQYASIAAPVAAARPLSAHPPSLRLFPVHPHIVVSVSPGSLCLLLLLLVVLTRCRR